MPSKSFTRLRNSYKAIKQVRIYALHWIKGFDDRQIGWDVDTELYAFREKHTWNIIPAVRMFGRAPQ